MIFRASSFRESYSHILAVIFHVIEDIVFFKAYKERWKKELSQDEVTPKRQRDATLQSQKDNLRQMEAQEEQRLARGQREYLDLEIRKFRRKKLLIFHSLEQELLREVSTFISRE